MPEVISLGEALIDFLSVQSGVSLIEAPGFEKAPGGAPANVAVGLAKLGVNAGFIGKVGDDPFGKFLAKTLEENGVDISGMVFESKARTALAFVSLTSEGERDFMFYRHPSADMLLEPGEIDEDYLKGAKIFHYGSITLISEPSRSATLKAVQAAKAQGALISYDPHLRLSLWGSSKQAKEGILTGLRFADILKVSEEEVKFITGIEDLVAGSKKLLEVPQIKLVVVTLGKEGSYFDNRWGRGLVAGFAVDCVDTTGAGGGFVAGLLYRLLAELKKGRQAEDLGSGELHQVLQFANAVGALTTTKKGAIPSLPYKDEVMRFLEYQG